MIRQRAAIAGVSVSPTGFFVMLQIATNQFVPLQVTDDLMDQRAATSPQALTVLQLLASVDMAGVLLPPDCLARIAVLACERKNTGVTSCNDDLIAYMQPQLRARNVTSFSELQSVPWMRSRIALPLVTLNELTMDDQGMILDCSMRQISNTGLKVNLTEALVEQVAYEYHPRVSRAFAAIALALRYRAPIYLTTTKALSLAQVQQQFPFYRTTAELQTTTRRVQANIEKGFKVNKLQAALRIARERGDDLAAAKIRVALDELDSLSDLPVQEESDMSAME